MNDNQVAALAMTDSDESCHNSTAAVQIKKAPRLRIWMANEDFFPVVNCNTIGREARIAVEYPRFPKRGGNAITETKIIKTPLQIFIALFFTPENYDAVCEMESDNPDDAFEFCGNNPRHAENWYNKMNRRSFSVGDVVEVIKDGKSEFHVCCSIGWNILPRSMEARGIIPTFTKE
jgi:hypothetical protein